MRITRFLLTRIAGMIGVLLLVSLATFLIFYMLPADPARVSPGRCLAAEPVTSRLMIISRHGTNLARPAPAPSSPNALLAAAPQMQTGSKRAATGLACPAFLAAPLGERRPT